MDVDLRLLVARAQAGDSEAFGQLYEQFAPRVYNYLYYHVNARVQLAEDLTEEVFVKVLEKLDRYQDRGVPFASWIFRIAHNHLIDHVRAQPKQRFVSIDDCQDLPELHAERSLDLALTHSELTRVMTRLTEDQRRVIVLRFLQGMSTAETSRVLGKTEDAVKKLQSRGLQLLKKHLSASREVLAVA